MSLTKLEHVDEQLAGSASATLTGKDTPTVKRDTPIEIKEVVIDNPGKGNCGYYAFAIGLIYIIQEESLLNDSKAMFNRWVGLDSSLEPYYDRICAFDFEKRDNELLEVLQRILRLIAYDRQLKELLYACSYADKRDEYRLLVATSAYRKFTELYYGKDVDPRFNEFVHSAEIRDALAKVDRKKVVPEHESLVLAPLFMSLVYGEGVDVNSISSLSVPSSKSPILGALQQVTHDTVWATHLELDYLARSFKVNLHTLENGTARYKFEDLPGWHTVTVNNQYNAHWTTKVTMAKVSKTATPDTVADQKSTDPTSTKKTAAATKGATAIPAPMKTEGGSVKTELGTKKVTPPLKKAAQKKDPIGIPHNNSKKKPESVSLKSLDSSEEKRKLNLLKAKVNRAVIAYCSYSDSIWFSFFHRHGETGRERARTFNKSFAKVKNYEDAKMMLVTYLNNDKNGNTHPHSFRTMLLQELLETTSNRKPALEVVSAKYHDRLAFVEKRLGVDNTAMPSMSL